MMRFVLGAVCALTVAVASASAQQSNLRVRGTIEQVDGPLLTIKSRAGETLKVKLIGDAKVAAVVKAQLSDIKPGTFVGATAVPEKGDRWQATEVHIFPESMRGTGEGDRAYDAAPKSTMTNGTVGAVAGGKSTMGGAVTNASGTMLTLDFQGGKKIVDVTPDTKVVGLVPGNTGDLKPGAAIMIPTATRQADGTLAAARVNVGRDGVAPPM
ncbi:MAG TPA: hypothetical protein VI251_01950 [Pseudolabrys sp.]|jgi:hypothetical protein